MSAFVVTENHTDYLVHAFAAWVERECDPARMSDWAHVLERENVRSVNFRYAGSSHVPEEAQAERRSVAKEPPLPLDPVTVLKAIACYEYQACETSDWEQSDAFAWSERLKAAALARLPEYSNTAPAEQPIDYLVNARVRWLQLGWYEDEMAATARMLELELVRTVNHEIRGSRAVPAEAQPDPRSVPYLPVKAIEPRRVLRTLESYPRTRAEDGDPESRRVDAWLEGLRSTAIAMLPGYDEAPWAIS